MPLQFIICLIAGALIAPSLAPFDAPYLGLIPPLALYLCSFKKDKKKSALLGWAFGFGFFGSGVSWVFVSISEHSQTPVAVAAVLTALFVAALALLFSLQLYLWKRFFAARLQSVSFIGLWVIFEWLRSWLFTGFPWLYLGNSALDTPFQNLLPIGGVWLSTFAILITAIAIAELLRTRRLLPLLIIPLPLIGSYLLPTAWTEPTGQELSVALAQPNIPQAIKWNPAYKAEILTQYETLSRPHLDTQLLLWPETAIPAIFQNAAEPLAELLNDLDQNNVTLISGLPSAIPDSQHPKGYRIHNSLAVLTSGSGIYHKQRLVPFGEYVPMESYIRGLFDFFNLPMSSFSLPKEETQSLLRVGNHTLSAAICYEIAYPELVRLATLEADILLTVSNDTWFGHSIAPAQHLQIARIRAVENGRWLIRGTNNGITAIVDSSGKIVEQLPQFTRGVLRGKVHTMQGHTPYQTYGSIPVLLLSALFMLIALGQWRNPESAPHYPNFR